MVTEDLSQLTVGQRRFAEQEHATKSLDAEPELGLIFLYRTTQRRTFRWLVDWNGQVVSADSFPRSA